MRRLEEILRKRRAGLHLVVENIADPHNAASLLRTAEALGVQHVHVIESVNEFQLPAAPHPDRGSLGRTDGGESASRWLTLHMYRSAAAALTALRELGLVVYVSDCPARGVRLRECVCCMTMNVVAYRK